MNAQAEKKLRTIIGKLEFLQHDPSCQDQETRDNLDGAKTRLIRALNDNKK